MNIMTVQGIRRVKQNRLEYSYTIEGEWSRYFESANPMWTEYSQPVDQIPDSIAVLPLIGNVIVLASLMDADIYVDEIDRDFYECIEEFIEGYDNIMPDHVHFKHRDIVHARKIVDSPLAENGLEENLLFFSGGVDATFSLISHLEEKPALVTIWGADIPWDNVEIWEQAIGFNREVADQYSLKMLTIRSNFRKSFNNNLEAYSMELVNDWWWPAFHHSVSMMCLAAPISCSKRKKLYFGSTFSSKSHKEWGHYIIASDPQIDNHVHFCGCSVVHDGYAFSRYDKIKAICEYYDHQQIKPYLRVCYHSNTGKNCSICEKCARAIMPILLCGQDPCDYGFEYQEETFPWIFAAGLQEMARAGKYACLSDYKDMQIAYRNKYSIDSVPTVLRAFYESELEMLVDFLHVPNNELIARNHAAKKHEEELYRQIGQLQYQLQVAIQSEQERVDRLSSELTCANEEKQNLEKEKYTLLNEKTALEEYVQKLVLSTSWRVTKPLRYVGEILRKIKWTGR